MKAFLFGVGIESVIRFERAADVTKTRNTTSTPFINFTSIDPIKKIFGLNDSVRMKLMQEIRPKQLAVDSMINYREYARKMQDIIQKTKKRTHFSNAKQKRMWSIGSEKLEDLEHLRSLVIASLASDIEV